MPPAATAVAAGFKRGNQSAKVHPMGGSENRGKIVEEDTNGEELHRQIKRLSVVDLASEERPCFVVNASCCVVDPRSAYIRRWEYVTISLLLWTAVVTPFEVGFLATNIDALFFINRLIDLCFLKDLVLNFRLAYFESTGGRTLVTDLKKIAHRYLKGWFWVDLVSIIPFEVIGLVVGSDVVSRLKILRILRLLRLFKLIKILRSAAILRRWQSRVGIKYSIMSLAKYMTFIVFVAHWMGCFWHVVTRLEDESAHTWVKETFNVAKNVSGVVDYATVDDIPVSHVYCASLYHATMTLTTIGYGDVTATTTTERWFSVVIQLMGASLYAYIVGVASGIVSSMNKEKMHFQETMDELNDFMEDQGLTDELTIRLREFFQHSRDMEKLRMYNNLLSRMSPGLRGEVASLAYGKMIEAVPYFQGLGENFISAISLKLSAVALSPGELITAGGIPAQALYFVAKGVVSTHGTLQYSGHHFGEEVILESGQQRFPVRAITFCSLHVLSKESLGEILSDFPRTARRIRRRAIKMAFRRRCVRTIKRLTSGESVTPQNITADDAGVAEALENESTACLTAMQQLQTQLLEKDAELQNMLQECVALQAELQEQVPMVELHMQTLQSTTSQRAESSLEAQQRTELLEVAKEVWRLQERLATTSSTSVKDAQFKFWKARQALIRNAIPESA